MTRQPPRSVASTRTSRMESLEMRRLLSVSSNPGDLVAFNGKQLLITADDAVHGREPWVSDGTTDGTTLVLDILG